MEGWRKFRIKDIAVGVYDGPHATPKTSETGPVFLGIKNITEDGRFDFSNIRHIAEEDFENWTKRVVPQKNDIVFSYEATLNLYAIIPEDLRCCLGRRMGLLRLKEEIVDPRFMYYYFFTQRWRGVISQNLLIGATVNRIPIGDFPDFEVFLPSISQQRKIADMLWAIDQKIELNNKINAELEAMAKLIYDYWFVQFDFPDENGKPYKSSGGKMVYNEELKREIPEGWEVKRIIDIADTGSGATPLSSNVKYYENGTIPWINSGEVNQPFLVAPTKFVTDLALKETSVRLYEKETILVAMYGATAGKVSFLDFEAGTNQAICAIIPKRKEYNSLIKFALEDLYEHLINLSTGSARDNLSQDKLKQLQIVVPTENVLTQYSEFAKPCFDKILVGLRENQELASLRDWLLPMLMNGQVKVGEGGYAVEQQTLAKVAEAWEEYGGGKVVQIPPPPLGEPEEQAFVKRKMLASYIINKCEEDPHFGHTKFEKLLHLSDYYVLQRNLNQNYVKKAAGPYDNRFTIPFFDQIFKAQWFAEERHGDLQRIVPGPKNHASQKTYDYFTEEELRRIDGLIELFSPHNYEVAEVISTLYAVWNNRLILTQPISDELLKADFLAWDAQKVKYANRLDGALEWMRKNGVVPNGWGKVIEKR